MAMTYRWGDGNRWKIKAQVVGREIERVRQLNGGNLRAADLVAAASAKNSPIHSMFEWDDAKAAHAHRVQQARVIICTIMAVPNAKPECGPMRAFVNVRENKRTFTSLERAMSVPDLRHQIIEQALTELRGWRARYATYKELGRVFEAIDQAIPKSKAA